MNDDFDHSGPGPRPPRDAAKREFAARLDRLRISRGWNQSELARQAALHMPDGIFGRDSVSGYLRGISLPGPVHLNALARALKVQPADLVPARPVAYASDKAPPFEVRDYDGDNAWVKVNQSVPWPIALQIMQLVKGK